MLDGMSDSIQGSRIENLHSREVDRQSPTGLIFIPTIFDVFLLRAFVHLHMNVSVKEPNISIYFFFPPITQRCSVSDVLFTGGRGESDFSVLKYY